MELRRNGKKINYNDSLLLTDYISSDPFVAIADQNYEKKRLEDRKKLIEELNRRNIEGSYDV